EQRSADSQTGKDAHRESDAPERVSFVVVDAPLHGGNRDVADFADDKIAGVSFGAGARKVWDVSVGNYCAVAQLVGESAQARAEHQRDLGQDLAFLPDERRGFAGTGIVICL